MKWHRYLRVQGPSTVAKANSQFKLEIIEEQLTLDLLKDLKTGKATGVDVISPRFPKAKDTGIAGSLINSSKNW